MPLLWWWATKYTNGEIMNATFFFGMIHANYVQIAPMNAWYDTMYTRDTCHGAWKSMSSHFLPTHNLQRYHVKWYDADFFFSFPWNTKLSQKRSCERKVGIFFPSWKKNNVCHEYSRHWDRKKDLFLISAFNIDLTWYKRFTRWILFVRGMKITSKLLVNNKIGWKMVAVLHKRYHNSSLASKDSLIISYFFETKHSNYHRNRNLIILNHNDCVIRCCFGFH